MRMQKSSLMPVLLMYTAYGAEVVSRRLSFALPGIAVVAFTGIMSIVFVCVFYVSSASSDALRSFYVRCEGEIPSGSSVGVWGNAGTAYEMSERRIAHVPGIYSPEFFTSKSMAGRFEILRNEPETRFEYWLCNEGDVARCFLGKADEIAGGVVLTAPPGLEMRKADWEAYDAGRAAPPPPVDGLRLAAKMDVAYARDEQAGSYEQISRDDYPLFAPFHSVGKLRDKTILDCGRFLLGGDAMTVSLEPGKDVHVVMRTSLECSASVEREVGHARSKFSFKSPMRLRVLVDDVDAGEVEFEVKEGDFCDAHFVISGKFITTSSPRLAFLGEHIAFCYWFYQ